MEIDSASLEGALEVLGQLLEDRGLHYEVVAIGGGSLLLLGLIQRTILVHYTRHLGYF